jgi:hypothetical protein
MNNIVKLLIGLTALLAAAAVGYWGGELRESHIAAKADRQNSVATMSTVTGALYLMDTDDISGARRVLIGLGSSNLDPILAQWNTSTPSDKSYLRSECHAMMRLKKLRIKYNFLGNPEDSPLRNDLIIAPLEAKRKAFLESLHCDD